MKTKKVTNEELLQEIKRLREEVQELSKKAIFPIIIQPGYMPSPVNPWQWPPVVTC